MTITYHRDLVQGSDEWLAARCGLLTASEMRLAITAKQLRPADNDKLRDHVWEIAAQRITGYVEPAYIGSDMLRGMEDEHYARAAYAEHFGPVEEVGFITNDKWGFTLGYSPDGLVGRLGAIEAKSRRQKFQVEVIIGEAGAIPADHMLQMQTGLLVAEREWVDYLSYCGGLPMAVLRVPPDTTMQSAIIAAAEAFEEKVTATVARYRAAVAAPRIRMVPTERRLHEEMFV